MRCIALLICFVFSFSVQAQTDVRVPLKGSLLAFQNTFSSHSALNDQLPPVSPMFGYRNFWMHCEQPLTTAHLQDLNRAGVYLAGYVHPGTYLVAIPVNIEGNPLQRLPITGFLPVAPAHKVAPEIIPFLDEVAPSKDRLNLTVRYFETLHPFQILQALKEEGFSVASMLEGAPLVEVTIPRHRLLELAMLPVVQYIELTRSNGEPEDNYGRAMHRSNLLIDLSATPGLHLDGDDVGVLVRDDGQIGPHIDFAGRLNQQYCYRPATDGTHGDMVSGIVAGAGNLLPFVRGMAPGARLYTQDYLANFLGQTMDIINNEGVVITNSSYSDGCNDGYTNHTVTVDRQIYDNPQLMHVFSAGNAGTSDCDYGAGPFWGNITGGHKAGKNSIATANLFNDYTLVNSSSRGPVFDGRIKPDIAANGQNQLSTFPFHTIDLGGGTSAAAPGIAGILAQLNQGYRLDHNSEIPPSALLKGALLTTASDLGNPGPDFIFGWGHVNAYQAHQLLTEQRYQVLDLDPGETYSTMITVPANTAEVRFMIYWPDPPAIQQATKALINDLELRVFAPGSPDALLPLILDPTPNATNLNAPAVAGEDHLNNMEQVRISDPAAGDYAIHIQGLTLPFGSTRAYLLWEFRTDEPTLVYPGGGESFEPGQANRIYWEAMRDQENWSVDLSLDSGATWMPLAEDIPASLRFVNITYPDTFSHQAYVRLNRGGTTVSHSTAFQLLGSPVDLKVVKACPDSITYEWLPTDHATGYDLFTMGAKTMEIIGSTTATTFTLPTANPLADNWLALRSVGEGPLVSERNRAVLYKNGLYFCKQAFDLRPDKIVTPSLTIQSCDPVLFNMVLSIRNDGINPVSEVPIFYQQDQKPPVADTISGTINPGGFKLFKFDQQPYITQTGMIPLRVWTTYEAEDFRFNDTLSVVLKAQILSTGMITPNHTEWFEASVLPDNWSISNPDEAAGWMILGYDDGGPDSNYAAIMPNFFSPELGQIDILSTPQIDLTKVNKPALRFDLSYSGIVGLGLDTLYIEISTDCGETIEKIVYMKTGQDLITIPNSASIEDSWVPESSDQWREEHVDLTEFAGQKIQIRFVNHSGYGNNLWIDRIRFLEEMPSPLQAGISLSQDTVCIGFSLVIEDVSGGLPKTFDWQFGESAVPATAQLSGPHLVTYLTSGWKTIQLIVGDGIAFDTTTKMVYVSPQPDAQFTWMMQADTLFLTNTTLYGSTYSWSVNQMPFSTLADPFLIPTEDEVLITLIASSACGDDTLSQSIKTTAVYPAEPGISMIRLTPNPTSGQCRLSGHGGSGDLYVEVLDMSTRVVWQQSCAPGTEDWSMPIDLQRLTAGSYLMRLWRNNSYHVLPFQVQ
ncbi:MAG: S8 family serine peptidase [Saprospiraceae bacterium]|nr:S8 family serine peptidase [Saprospiraceae bacterium]